MLTTRDNFKSAGPWSAQLLISMLLTLIVTVASASIADARQIYVPTRPLDEEAKGAVTVIESETNQIVKTINTGVGTKAISAAVSPDGTRAYVVSNKDDGDDVPPSFMNVIDTETNELVEDPIGLEIAGAGAIAASPDGKYMYITFRGSIVGVFDTEINRLTRVASFTDLPGLRVVALQIAVSPDGENLYVTAVPGVGEPEEPAQAMPGVEGPELEEKPGVYVLPVERIFNPDPENVECQDNDGREICSVQNAWDGFVEVDSPFSITLTPDGDSAWVGSWTPEATLLDLSILKAIDTVSIGANRAPATAVNSDASRLYIGSVWSRGGGFPRVHSYDTSSLDREWSSGIELPSVGAIDIAVTPNGQRIYYSDLMENVDVVPPEEFGTGRVSVLSNGGGLVDGVRLPEGLSGLIAITPNQGPQADLIHEVGDGGEVRFDASGSSDSDGSIAQYVWDFGDGTERTTDTPEMSNRYANLGAYTASVRAIDNEGGSTEFIHTGRTAMHNGSDAARASVSFKIEADEQPPGSDPDPGPGNPPTGGSGGTGVGSTGDGGDRCARPTYKLKVKSSRYIRAKDLKKGLKVGITSTHKSKADIKVSLRRKEINRLGLYKKTKKKKTVGTKKKVGLTANKERQVKVRITGKLRKAITKKRRNRVRIKVEVVSRATGVPRWRKMERRASVSTVAKRRGKAGNRQVSRTAKVRAISPCAKRLKVKLKSPRQVRTKKALKLQITSSASATGTIEFFLRGSDRKKLKLTKSLSKRIYRAKVKLSTNRKLKKNVRLKSKTRRKLSRALRSRGLKTARVKLVVKLKGNDGQRVRKAKTVRLKR